ncbi:hypothetical protein [Pararhodobacter oceanensis]|uniref:hypothetical protein n=1 Tax=Pararhodobacter oceanensis TaxID=2172121 RepID=UPI003A8D0AE1
MRLWIALILALLAAPLQAFSLDAFEGRWRGEGGMVLNAEPEQRFRCRIRLRQIDPGQSFFTGRCATSQAAQSFTYMLFETSDGRLRAENTASVESNLPLVMLGQASDGLLRLHAEEDAMFELQLTAGALQFRMEGEGDQGFARGIAHLTRRD